MIDVYSTTIVNNYKKSTRKINKGKTIGESSSNTNSRGGYYHGGKDYKPKLTMIEKHVHQSLVVTTKFNHYETVITEDPVQHDTSMIVMLIKQEQNMIYDMLQHDTIEHEEVHIFIEAIDH
jgi:hypothetical protein